MALSEEETVGLLRDLVQSSYTSLRPGGKRGIRGADLLRLAHQKIGPSVTQDELDDAVTRVGGEAVQVTSAWLLVKSRLGQGDRWRRGYLLPSDHFDGLRLPARLRTPRSPKGTEG